MLKIVSLTFVSIGFVPKRKHMRKTVKPAIFQSAGKIVWDKERKDTARMDINGTHFLFFCLLTECTFNQRVSKEGYGSSEKIRGNHNKKIQKVNISILKDCK